MSKNKIELPKGLLSAVREQRAILFLGSGASLTAKTPDSRKMPTAGVLASDISDKFLSNKFKNKDLMRVSEIAESQAGKNVFNDWLREYFEPFSPTDSHLLVPSFRWKAIATTNYDLLLEKAYESHGTGGQELVVRVKDDQPIETMMSAISHPLEYLKLHGCIDSVHDKDVPLVLTPTSYNDYEEHRQDLYHRLEALGREYPIIFCGHSLDDLHIRRLVENDKNSSRPFYYIVSPDFEPEEKMLWASKRVEAVGATFEQLISSLDISLPPLMRMPIQIKEAVETPHRKKFKVQEQESDETAFAFANEFTYLHQDIPVDDTSAEDFYSGHNQGWGNIRRNFDVHRRVSHQILEYIAAEETGFAQLAVVQGAAGFGKTIALQRSAWELACSFDEFTIWMNDDSKLKTDVIAELHTLTGKRLFVFIDHAGLNSQKIEEILAFGNSKRIPVTVVTAERTNEWSMFCNKLEKYNPKIFNLSKLSGSEVDSLLDKLTLHKCLGILEGEPRSIQTDIIIKKLDRQLLVALHEITKGEPFEYIVAHEYEGISPAKAQELYLNICTLHRYDVPLRAGVVSRVADISFQDFEKELFAPLEGLVFTHRNRITGDWEYRSRHALVSELVFNQVCSTDEERQDQLLLILDGLDVSFRSDDLALSQLIKGKNLAETFGDVPLVRGIYALATKRNPSKTYILQQQAIFEYTHRKGDLIKAKEAIESALALEPENPSFLHTSAQVLRRQSLQAKSDFARQGLRSQARGKLDKIQNQNNAYVLGTKARLRVDAVSEAIEKLKTDNSETAEDYLADAIDAAEKALHRAFNMYPNDPDFLDASSILKQLLGENKASTELLQRAWEKMPRGTGIAKRLARRYLQIENSGKAEKVLLEAKERDPSDRSVNLFLANIQFRKTNDLNDKLATSYLSQSFVSGDREFFARFVTSAQAFASREYDRAYQLLDDIENNAPYDFKPKLGRMEKWVEPFLLGKTGVIKKTLGAYLFLSMRDCPRDIYASSDGSEDDIWDQLSNNQRVKFDIVYYRKGPVAINIECI